MRTKEEKEAQKRATIVLICFAVALIILAIASSLQN